LSVIKPMFVLAAAMIAEPALAQDTMAAPAAPTLPMCSAKVIDNCQQNSARESRAMSGDQAKARNASAGSVRSPNKAAPDDRRMDDIPVASGRTAMPKKPG
jgi:hypothetical protein